MVYGIPTVPRRAREKPLLQIIHGPCIFLQFFCVCRHKHVLNAEYGIPNVHTLASEKPLLHISHGPCILLQFFVIAGTSMPPLYWGGT